MDFDLPDTAVAVRDGVAAVAAKYDHAYWSRCEEEHRFPLGDGRVGPVTQRLSDAYMDIVRGVDKRFTEWRTPVYQAVGV